LGKLAVTWVKSEIGFSRDQRRTIQALGLHRLNQTVMHEDTRSMRGMLLKVRHLVKVEETGEGK